MPPTLVIAGRHCSSLPLLPSLLVPAARLCSLLPVAPAFARARANTKAPTLIEFVIDRELDILPMVPGGNALSDMVTEYKKERK